MTSPGEPLIRPQPASRRTQRLIENLRLLPQLSIREVWPGLCDVAAAVPGDASRLVGQLLHLGVESVLEKPPAAMLAMLRALQPVAALGPMTLATRADDVIAILEGNETFSVQPYTPTMVRLAGPFVLGMDGDDHAAARRALASALAPMDSAALQTWADEQAHKLTAQGRREGRLDIVADFADPLSARFAADYLGVPGPDERTLMSWARTIFEDIFITLSSQRSLAAEAEQAAAQLRAHIDTLLAVASDETDVPPMTVLQRLIHAPRDTAPRVGPEAVRTDLVALVVASVPTMAQAISHAVDHLLSSAGAFAGARAAAVRDDRELLWTYIREALRMSPPSPGLVRAASTPTAVGQPPRQTRQLREGDLVLASTAAAMRDPAHVHRPRQFDPGRDDGAYLHFGAGPHRCLGEHIAPVVITAAVAALFRHPGLRRVPGPNGRLSSEGHWPAHLTVAW